MDCAAYINVIIASFALNVFMQVASVKCFKGMGLLRSVFISFPCGFIVNVLLGAYLYGSYGTGSPDAPGYLLASILTYACLGYCYFHFINMTETARRIRILTELQSAPAGLSMEEIMKRYSAGEIIEKRLSRLMNNGQIALVNDRFYAKNSSMAVITNIILFMKLIIFGKRMV